MAIMRGKTRQHLRAYGRLRLLYYPFFPLFLGLFLAPANLQASTTCGPSALSAGGYFFTSYESISRTEDGLPILHLKVQPQFADGRAFNLGWSFQADDCQSADVTAYSERFSLPIGVTDWSIRFTSLTHFDVWDDQHEVIMISKDIGSYPAYDHISFSGLIDGGASTFLAQSLQLTEGATAPVLSGGISAPEPCMPISGGGYFFDGTYEHAEYVDGLLRIHLRLATPYNDGRTFSSRVVAKSDDCVSDMEAPKQLTRTTFFTPRTRYYSLRMTSPTHFELWDDETNTKFDCGADCAGDIPEGTSFVGWHGSIDAGASYIISTAFPPTETVSCGGTCASNILFLPGIMGSRLEENGVIRWEPSGDADVIRLYLDESGKSENDNISATEVIGEFNLTGTSADLNIYKSFFADLSEKKTDGDIADYAAYPYDWRLSIPDILADGALEQTLRNLAASSKTGKVTIVAHSNGGLIAKALVSELDSDASDLIDQLILVAVPQTGTPQAIGALLHGFDAGIPFVVDAERARDFSHNAPMIYQLLPHADYYSNVGTSIPTPLAVFEPGTATQPFTDAYGLVVGNANELQRFILGEEGRSAPTYNDLENPTIGNSVLFYDASVLMQTLGSSWQAPAGIMVHQIAGIGEDTLAGITYKTVKECTSFIFSAKICLAYEDKLSYTPEEVIDGDGTVVVPSALAMSDSAGNVKRWWVDLDRYNRLSLLNPRIFRKHANILEIETLSTFILDNLITKSSDTLPQFLSSTTPPIESEKRLRFVLHSPLTLTATADGTTYPAKRYGEVQVLTLSAELNPTITLTGVAGGSFTLEVQEFDNETEVASTTFSGIPSSANTLASISFPDGTIVNATKLAVDYDGDSTTDFILAPKKGEATTLEEPSLSTLLATLKAFIGGMDIKDNLKKSLLKKVDTLEKKIGQKKKKNAKVFAKLEGTISKQKAIGNIASADGEELLSLIEELEMQAEDVVLDAELLAALKEKIISLNLKKGLTSDLLRRIEKLEKKQQLTKALFDLTGTVSKNAEKGRIDDADAAMVLELLRQAELLL